MSRFVDISEEEIVHLEQSKDSLNTKRAIKRSVNIFREFLGPENAQFAELPKYILDNKLRNFYASLRTIKGDEVKKSTLNTIKYGLGKYLKDTCKIDIQTDAAFESSRKTFKAKLTDLQKKGKGAIQHKTEISTEDLERLMQPDNLAFNCNTPVGLQNKVWFQNRRAKWKKRKKTTNVFRTPGALMPTAGLSPFGSMNDPLCSLYPSDTRWSSMSQMGAAPLNANHLPFSTLPRQGISQSFPGQMGGFDAMNAVANLANNISMSNGNSSMYNSNYGLSPQSSSSPTPPTSIGNSQMTSCGIQDIGESWRGNSIASLRRKALEHSVSLTGFR